MESHDFLREAKRYSERGRTNTPKQALWTYYTQLTEIRSPSEHFFQSILLGNLPNLAHEPLKRQAPLKNLLSVPS